MLSRPIISLWETEGKSLFSGKLGNQKVIVLRNSSKKSDKSPDAYVFVAIDDEEKPKEAETAADPVDDDEIPF